MGKGYGGNLVPNSMSLVYVKTSRIQITILIARHV